jgi:exosome complex component RRP4
VELFLRLSTTSCLIVNIHGFSQVVPRADREVIARLRNCVLALASCKMMLYDTSIVYAFEESLKYEVSSSVEYSI